MLIGSNGNMHEKKVVGTRLFVGDWAECKIIGWLTEASPLCMGLVSKLSFDFVMEKMSSVGGGFVPRSSNIDAGSDFFANAFKSRRSGTSAGLNTQQFT